MISAIKNFAITIEENQESSDCAVVIILSHGGNGTIYAVDELAVDVSGGMQISTGKDCLTFEGGATDHSGV